MQGAHRLAWVNARGAIPDGLGALHKCDLPCCINDNHLFLGSQAVNVADMMAKGRQYFPTGAQHYRKRLPVEAIRIIRLAAETQKALAVRFGVTEGAISKIQNRRAWRHLP